MRLPVFLSAVLLSAVTPASGRAQEPFGGEFRVNAFTTGDQQGARAAADAVGNFVVAWTGLGPGVSGTGVFVQRFDASGARRGAEFRVNPGINANQVLNTVAGDAAGNFIVAWTDSTLPGLVVQRYGAGGERRGAELLVNAVGTPSLAANSAGRFVVVWYDGSVRAQRFDAGGNPVGAVLQANTNPGNIYFPRVGVDDAGGFVVTWYSASFQGIPGVFAQRYDAAGTRLGEEFRVTPLDVESVGGGMVAVAPGGQFLIGYSRLLSHIYTVIFGQAYGADGAPSGGYFRFSDGLGGQFDHGFWVAPLSTNGFAAGWSTAKTLSPPVDTALVRRFGTATGTGPVLVAEETSRAGLTPPFVAADGSSNLIAVFDAPADSGRDVFGRRFGHAAGAAITVDAAGNGVLDPGESVSVEPSWRNFGVNTLDIGGALFDFTGPAGADYSIQDASATYGPVDGGSTVLCGDCYRLSVSAPAVRPVQHWDALAREYVSPASQNQEKGWTLHVGRSFPDVPPSSPFYRFVEVLLHRGVAGGINGLYGPALSTTREQMAVFVLTAREGPGWAPPPCVPPNVFADVPETSPFCRWIEELFARGVVAGCGNGNYCPQQGVTRAAMAVFLLRTLDGAFVPPPCAPPNLFLDVPETNPFCPWVEELARRNVTGGCGGGNYCPDQVVTREQMAVFVSTTFGLTLYGAY